MAKKKLRIKIPGPMGYGMYVTFLRIFFLKCDNAFNSDAQLLCLNYSNNWTEHRPKNVLIIPPFFFCSIIVYVVCGTESEKSNGRMARKANKWKIAMWFEQFDMSKAVIYLYSDCCNCKIVYMLHSWMD